MLPDHLEAVGALKTSLERFLRLLSHKVSFGVPGYVPTFSEDSLMMAEDDFILREEQFQKLMQFLVSDDRLLGSGENLSSGYRKYAAAQVFVPGLALDFDVVFRFAGPSTSVVVTPKNLKYAKNGLIVSTATVDEFLTVLESRSGLTRAELLKELQPA